MAGHIPADVLSGASFSLTCDSFQGGLDEYVEAGGAGMLMRQSPRRDGCLASLWNPQRGSGW
jgi:hypothetical protein